MGFKSFPDAATAQAVFVETFRRASDDAQIRAAVLELNQVVFFDYSQDDPLVTFYVDARDGELKVGEGRPEEKPAVTILTSIDTGHKAWSNQLNPMMAMAMGQIKAKGSATSLLKLAPVLKLIEPIYKQVRADKGLS
ncbi:MAG: SCP2 sterol-binding domain-containing protein [Pseudomonadota bacterium]